MVRHLGEHAYDRRARVAVLTAVATAVIGRGASYLGPSWERSAHVSFVDLLIPVEVWSIVWIATGLALLVGIWCPRIARWAMSASVALWSTWAISYVAAWAFLGTSRAWVTALPFGLIAVLIGVLAYLMEPPEHIENSKRRRGDAV